MSISWYKKETSGDWLNIAVWDLSTTAYAEGGDAIRTGDPAADAGNDTDWGLNNQYREIADKLIWLYENKILGPGSATDSGVMLFDGTGGKTAKNSGITIKTTFDKTKDTEIPTSKAIFTWATFTGFSEKSTLANNDLFWIEDSEDSYAKKKVKASNLPSGSGGATDFTGLSDTPSAYTGEGSKGVRVKSDESGLEFFALLSTFLELADSPASYTGEGGKAVKVKSDESGLEFGDVASDKADQEIFLTAGNVYYPSDVAALNEDTGTYGNVLENLMGDAADEMIQAQRAICNDLDSAGTVNIDVWAKAATAPGTEKIVRLILEISEAGDGESWDNNWTEIASGDLTIGTVTDGVYRLNWTETVSNCGIAANDFVRFRIRRDWSHANDDLSGDLGHMEGRIRIPRS